MWARPKETTHSEDMAFRTHCSEPTCAFKTCMEFLRRPNEDYFRRDFIRENIPEHLKERIRTQCLLEGLI